MAIFLSILVGVLVIAAMVGISVAMGKCKMVFIIGAIIFLVAMVAGAAYAAYPFILHWLGK
jgi:hypothetical protein